jgi:hypothetical protein
MIRPERELTSTRKVVARQDDVDADRSHQCEFAIRLENGQESGADVEDRAVQP